MNKFETNISDKNVWFGFLGSYLGSALGAIITLIGIYYQIKYTEKSEKSEKMEGIIKYINYILKENLKSLHRYDMCIYENYIIKDTYNFVRFNDKFVDDNLKTFFTMSHGEKVIELNERLFKYQTKIDIYNKNKEKRKKILEEVFYKISEESYKNDIKIFYELRTILNIYKNYLELSQIFIEHFWNDYSDSSKFDKEKELYEDFKVIANKKEELKKTQYYIEDIFEGKDYDNKDLYGKSLDNLFSFDEKKGNVTEEMLEKKYNTLKELKICI